MTLENPNCPTCGEPAQGTVERLHGFARFSGVPGPGTPVEYSGWTEIWWDEQTTVHEHDEDEGLQNRPLVCCSNGPSWPTRIDQ